MRYASSSSAAITDIDEDFPARLVSLVGSRLCHDLVSPLGAIGNGVELLQMAGGGAGLADSQEMALIQDALKAARTRINCFRTAFGAAGKGQRVAPSELAALIADIESAGRMRIRVEADGDHSRGIVRLVLLALMCLETAMPWGARVVIRLQGRDWRLQAGAERVRVDPALWSWLDGTQPNRPDPAASEVQFPLLGLFAAEMNRPVRWTLDENGAEIGF